ncbi:MAG: ATP-dependent helicase/nuclease subunit A [Firmicutes bacterium ADurb.Bin354]|nr:MAG: ATP-dependent helicase/nuclease subunit A [Firmicutes bacterium ADurb.Bin354]
MSKMSFTKEQQQVIDLRHCNMLVSAAAGSGKTAVLTERILSLLCDKEEPADIDRMLIVTFTTAAAAEMRERINKTILSRLADEPENSHLVRQEALLQNARITTIDSFCLYVVKNHFSAIGLDPGFRTVDDGEKKLMQKEVMDELFEDEYSKRESDFINLVESYASEGREDDIEKMIVELFDSALAEPFPKEWLRRADEECRITDFEEVKNLPWFSRLTSVADAKIKKMHVLTDNAYALCLESDGPDKYLPNFEKYRNIVAYLERDDSYEERKCILCNFDPSSLSKAKSNADEKKIENAKKLHDTIKVVIKDLKALYCLDPDELSHELKLAEINTHALIRLTLEFMDRFAEAKRKKNVIDFPDMEHFALDILLKEEDGKFVPSDAALEYRDHFLHVFVDEYQDSNMVQELVLKSISRADNYFMVGDVKQSIYSFRRAKPSIFLEKYAAFSDEGINRRIDLNKNFRSRREVLDFVNDIFERVMHEDSAGLEYDDKAKLYVGASYPEPEGNEYDTEILKLCIDKDTLKNVKKKDDISDGDEDEADDVLAEGRAEYEALITAMKIRELMQKGFKVKDKDNGEMRPMSYRDVVILVRSLDGYDDAMKKYAGEFGIPLYFGSTAGYFSALEIKLIINALKTIDNPMQDIPLYGTLTGFLKIFDEEEMALLRGTHKNCTLYEAVVAAAEAAEDQDIRSKCVKFLEWLERFRSYASYCRIRDLLDRLLEQSDYLADISALPGGDQRRANVEILLERASEFESTSYHGLFHFVKYISGLKAREVDYGEAGMIDENADVVRLMTIHKSKGLEFPVVFCLGFNKGFNCRSLSDECLKDTDLGVALGCVDIRERIKKKGLKAKLFKEKLHADLVAEELRVLYVALTRAKEKLFITDICELGADGEPKTKEITGPSEGNGFMEMIDYALSDEALSDRNYYTEIRLSDIAGNVVSGDQTAMDNARELLMGDLPADSGILKILDKRREYRYPFPELSGLFTKTSVSELKKAAYEDVEEVKMFETDKEDAYIPSFAVSSEKSGAKRGSAFHRFLELFDFAGLEGSADPGSLIKVTLDKEISSGRLSADEADYIKPEKFNAFFESDIAMRMSRAAKQGKLYKEQPFFLGVPARELDKDFPKDESVIVQGVIDVYFEEEDGLVLLDYKTDRVFEGDELVKRYKKQLEIYSRALETILDKPVKENVIYSFALNKTIRI